MAFPNLALRSGGHLHSENTGIPVNGDNAFLLGIPANEVNTDWLNITVEALGGSITGASYVGLSADKLTVTINFVQAGADQAHVQADIIHSAVR